MRLPVRTAPKTARRASSPLFLRAAAGAVFALLCAAPFSCSNGESAAYDPDRTIAMELRLLVTDYSLTDTLAPSDSTDRAEYRVAVPCTLRFVPEISSLLDDVRRVWTPEELVEHFDGHYEWWLHDTVRNYGFSPAVPILDSAKIRARFLFVDAKGDTIADSLRVVARHDGNGGE
ncbi:MAG: hypothetical protein J6Z50_07605 [Fibrobacterales bacterium]|nr:hypothetical protein [Fibrobacterales bacterium]